MVKWFQVFESVMLIGILVSLVWFGFIWSEKRAECRVEVWSRSGESMNFSFYPGNKSEVVGDMREFAITGSVNSSLNLS